MENTLEYTVRSWVENLDGIPYFIDEQTASDALEGVRPDVTATPAEVRDAWNSLITEFMHENALPLCHKLNKNTVLVQGLPHHPIPFTIERAEHCYKAGQFLQFYAKDQHGSYYAVYSDYDPALTASCTTVLLIEEVKA